MLTLPERRNPSVVLDLDQCFTKQRAGRLAREEMMMTQSERVRRGHAWQKIQASECENQENGTEWIEVCIHCHADRRMAKRPNGQVRVLNTQPDRLPERCVKG